MYNLYFLKENKEINEINCDFSGNKNKTEQYHIFKKGNKNIINTKDATNMIYKYTNISKDKEKIDEKEYSLEDLTYEKLCYIKREEIISRFRMDYSLQERIIEMLKNNHNFIEYPNLIFYENNNDNLHYKEADRVLFLEKNDEFKLFIIYFSVVNNQKEFNGSILKLKANSINFIEIKRSISILEKQLSEIENKLNEKR